MLGDSLVGIQIRGTKKEFFQCKSRKSCLSIRLFVRSRAEIRPWCCPQIRLIIAQKGLSCQK